MKGKCYYCNKELTERTIKRHMKSCSSMKAAIDEKSKDSTQMRSQVLISIKPKKDKSKYCMYLSMDMRLSLKSIDDFIRDIWFKNEDYVSYMKIDNHYYTQNDMNMPFDLLCREELKFEYVYDYKDGISLELEVVDIFAVPDNFSQMEIVARNEEYGSIMEDVFGETYNSEDENKYVPGNENQYKIVDFSKKENQEVVSEGDYFDILSDEVKAVMDDMASTFEALMVKEFSLDISRIIKSLTKDDIYFMARRLGMEKISSLTKDKLAEKLLSEYEELISAKLELFDEDRFKALKVYAEEGVKSLDEIDQGIEEIMYFRNLGMLFFSIKNHDEVMMFIPSVLKDMIEGRKGFEYRSRLKNNSEVMTLFKGMMKLYGVVKIEDVERLISKYNVAPSVDIMDLIIEGQYYNDYTKWNDYFVSGDVTDVEKLINEINKDDNKDYADISKSDLMTMGSDSWLCETKYGKSFYDQFIDLFDIEPSVLIELMESLYRDIQELNIDEVIEMALSMVSDCDAGVVAMVEEILRDYVESVKLWKNRGLSLKDLSGVGKTVVKDKEIGRNEPCPCGSGKKYKKCCGKNSKVINLF